MHTNTHQLLNHQGTQENTDGLRGFTGGRRGNGGLSPRPPFATA
jgi:hypothetical protein